MREGCYKEGSKSKTYSVTIKSDTHAEQEAFKQLAANRYKIEAKNSELKTDTGTIRHRLRVYLAWKFKVLQRYSLSI